MINGASYFTNGLCTGRSILDSLAYVTNGLLLTAPEIQQQKTDSGPSMSATAYRIYREDQEILKIIDAFLRNVIV